MLGGLLLGVRFLFCISAAKRGINVKELAQLRKQSNDQLNDRLREINISIMRFQGYNKGGCSPPPEVASGEQRNNSMYFLKLKRERAQESANLDDY